MIIYPIIPSLFLLIDAGEAYLDKPEQLLTSIKDHRELSLHVFMPRYRNFVRGITYTGAVEEEGANGNYGSTPAF